MKIAPYFFPYIPLKKNIYSCRSLEFLKIHVLLRGGFFDFVNVTDRALPCLS